MPKQTAKHKQAVIDYYDNTRAEYRILWRNHRNLGLHFGYYDDAHTTHNAAVLNLNAQLSRRVKITQEDTVLDAGCGVGGSAIWLAENIGCDVTGIGIVPRQIERAKQNASTRNVPDRTRFLVADFADMPFKASSFTVFWGVESVVHAQNKQAVLKEAYRTLGKGGRLIIAEYLLEEPTLSEENNALLRIWLDGWEMPGLESETSYRRMLANAGFKHIKIYDWTQHMLPSFARLNSLSKKFRAIAPLLSALRLANSSQRRNLAAAEAQMKLLQLDVWRYKIVVAVKR